MPRVIGDLPDITSRVTPRRGRRSHRPHSPRATRCLLNHTPPPAPADLCDARGHATARRALEIGATSARHLLFVDPPGPGKSILARRLPGVPPMRPLDQALEVTTSHSVAGLLAPGARLTTVPPFRPPPWLTDTVPSERSLTTFSVQPASGSSSQHAAATGQ